MWYSTSHYCCPTISYRILTFDELLIQKDTQIHYTNHILFIQGRWTYKFSYLCHILYLRSFKNNVYLWNNIVSSNVELYIHIDHIHNYCVRRIFRFAPTFFLKPSKKCVLLGSKNNKVLEFAFRLFVSGIISNKNVQNISQPHCFVSYGISSPYKFTCKNCVYIFLQQGT